MISLIVTLVLLRLGVVPGGVPVTATVKVCAGEGVGAFCIPPSSVTALALTCTVTVVTPGSGVSVVT